MLKIYRVSPEQLRTQKRRTVGAAIALFIGVPVGGALGAMCVGLRLSSITTRDIPTFAISLGLPVLALLLRAVTMPSLRYELEDDRVTRVQQNPLTRALQRLSFSRREIRHIREVRKSGLVIHGRGSGGKYIDLEIPPYIENYDELRGHLAAWQPIHDSWI
jgi:hypothetical protein